MRVGIVILPDQRWSEASRRWRQAEEYGFDHAWTYDHMGWRDLVDGPWFDAVPVLTAAALVTSRIRLGTMVASPNFRHPAHFAREVTALDDMAGGRLTLGLGAGGMGYDATVLGLPAMSPRQRVDRFAEFVTLLDGLLRDGSADFSGEHYRAVDARSTPGCVQRPRAPFVVAANGPRSMRLAARFGQGWVTTGERSTDLGAWWQSVAELAKRFDDVEAAAGRGPGELDRMLSLDAAPVFSLSSAGFFADAAGRARELGFTDVITHWPRSDSWYAGSEATLETVAKNVLPAIQQTAPRLGPPTSTSRVEPR
ncbi:LLM class flavin-dependent oxidoreductase [Nonomuraea turcica]|uniref:LLM class flavin-dependent oxidoreductase n=1 Tax=Nonomuraea sp. G32 TaxID=3067274 RepID=UPI00273AE9EF|nr:LLM class flavin-dependent oxidoreductase [Nonomuraea sp. G32]MDP4502579.1 LLM class flavin-dependent oxidoreductase [Nonomuraea sp. G32]